MCPQLRAVRNQLPSGAAWASRSRQPKSRSRWRNHFGRWHVTRALPRKNKGGADQGNRSRNPDQGARVEQRSADAPNNKGTVQHCSTCSRAGGLRLVVFLEAVTLTLVASLSNCHFNLTLCGLTCKPRRNQQHASAIDQNPPYPDITPRSH